MEVTRYIFQSPYSSQVQVGRPETITTGAQKSGQDDAGLIQSTNQSLNNAETFKATQIQDVEPDVKSSLSSVGLDTYA